MVLRWQLPVVLAIVGLTALFSLRYSELRLEDEVEMWFSLYDPVLKTCNEFREVFPSDEFNLVAFETRPPLDAKELTHLLRLQTRLETVPYISEVITLEKTGRRCRQRGRFDGGALDRRVTPVSGRDSLGKREDPGQSLHQGHPDCRGWPKPGSGLEGGQIDGRRRTGL